MSKWRPVPKNCLYVIPDIHGMLDQLKLILNRLLPLRKTSGGKDRIVFLGDYIDRRANSHLVIDLLISLKEKYGDQVICLKGNHEDMMMDALKPSLQSNDYLFWMKFGGEQTLRGYLDRAGIECANPYTFLRNRIPDIVPKEHIKFLNELEAFYETDDFIFVHAGCNPAIPLHKQEQKPFYWDRSLYDTVRERLSHVPLPWDKTIVTGHNGDSTGNPYIRQNFLMLDGSTRSQLYVVELGSMEAFLAKEDNKALVKVVLTESTP